jgi:hypothetical protein
MIPGRRLKLHPDDLYAFGAQRGGINERWFSSTTKASNGPATTPDEGLSYVHPAAGAKFLLKDAVECAGDILLGTDVMEREGGWNLLCKFFDNLGPIPHHMHQSDEFAKLVGHKGKPEAYYFPPQYNQISNNFPHTYMGLEPGTTKDDIRRCLENWNRGDNGIIFHARAYRLEPGSGWQIDPGILHAPGSLVTYEPQVNSDVFAMPEFHHDLDYLISMLDWEANVNPEFAKSNKRHPVAVRPVEEMEESGYREMWITYGGKYYSAKELTVLPGRSVTIQDAAAYGLILTQGHGDFGGTPVSTPSMIRFGDLTEDELFVTATAAKSGVYIENPSHTDPLVILKHFGPGNPDAESLRRDR